VFRDNANLTGNVDLCASIEDALAPSRWFVLMASPGRRPLAMGRSGGALVAAEPLPRPPARGPHRRRVRLGLRHRRTDHRGAAARAAGLAFAPDGGTLAVGDQDRAVAMWDMTDRARPRRLGTQLTRVSAPVAFAPDGHTLLTGGPDNAASRWDLTPLQEIRADPARAACARAGTALAPDIWAFFAPGVEYRDTCASR
jgi:hypothetical protein